MFSFYENTSFIYADSQVQEQLKRVRFHWIDYLVFFTMIISSAVTGVYFGYYRHRGTLKQKIEEAEQAPADQGPRRDFGSPRLNDYLLGSKRLYSFPVAMSLIGGYISGITMLGTPSEIYYYGTQYWFILIPVCIMAVVVSFVFLPVFVALRVGSSYQYLEMRFGKILRLVASVLFVIDELFFLPITVYVPALAFNQVSGVNIHIIVAIVTLACVIYTIVGGIKAVVATDAWQIVVMFISVMLIVIIGTVNLGGMDVVFKRAKTGGRLIYANLTPSMYERQSLFAVIVGGTSYWVTFNSVNQTMVQRYLSLPNLKKSQTAIFIFAAGVLCFISVCAYSGLLIYATYWKCDPMGMHWIEQDDQLFPIYVMQTAGNLHGIPGVFIAGVCGAALSSLSVVLNSTGAIIMEDIVKGGLGVKLTDRGYTIVIKITIFALGIISMMLVAAVERLGAILEVGVSFSAIAAATSFGIFFLGMLVPWSNKKGAVVGAVCGALMSAWIAFGSQITKAAGYVRTQKLPTSIEDCNPNATIINIIDTIDDSDIFPLYRLSFHFINPIGAITTIIVGVIVSFITGPTDIKTLDAALISPVIHRFLPKECFVNTIADEVALGKPLGGKRIKGDAAAEGEKKT